MKTSTNTTGPRLAHTSLAAALAALCLIASACGTEQGTGQNAPTRVDAPAAASYQESPSDAVERFVNRAKTRSGSGARHSTSYPDWSGKEISIP